MSRGADLSGALAGVPGVTIRTNEPIKKHGNLRMGGEVEIFIVVHQEEALLRTTAALRAHRVRWRLQHGFSDLWSRDEEVPGALLRLGPNFATVASVDGGLLVGAGAPLAAVGVAAAAAGCRRLAPLAAWPGTLGAWLEGQDPRQMMLVKRVRFVRGRTVHEGPPASLPGTAVLLAAVLDGAARRLPSAPPSPGALAPDQAGLPRMLEKSALLGMRLRRVRLSKEAPGLVVNMGGAEPRDMELVLRLVDQKLRRDHGVELQHRLAPMTGPAQGRRR